MKTPNRAIWPLIALNFFIADVQSGIGPFISVFLQSRGYGAGMIGTILTLGAIVGTAVTTPAGAFVDATRYKRGMIALAGFVAASSCGLLWFSGEWWMVAVAQVAAAVAGAAVGPALAGITLGLVRQTEFDQQFGRNQVANHAGNLVVAALSGWMGWRYGFGAVFVLSGVFGLLSIVSVALIPKDSINHRRARGLTVRRADEQADPEASRFRVLIECRPLLLLSAALALFHLGNAGMLPLYSMSVISGGQTNPSAFTAKTIVIAQVVMIVASFYATRLIRWRGYWWVLLGTFVTLPVRALFAAWVPELWGVWPVQLLDGISAGLQSVAVPALMVRLMHGTGRVNVGQGVVLTVQGVGASLSPALGGWLAQHFGYRFAFLSLGALSVAPLVLWIVFREGLHHASRGGSDEEDDLTGGRGVGTPDTAAGAGR